MGQAEEVGAEGSLVGCTLLPRGVVGRPQGDVRAVVGSTGTVEGTRMAWWRVEDCRGCSGPEHLEAEGSAGELEVAKERWHPVTLPQVP